MKKLSKYLDNAEENIITVLLPTMCLLIFASTFFRYTKLLALPWAEEMARYLMVWIIFLGVGTAAKKGSHFAVEVFVKSRSLQAQKVFALIRLIIVIGFCSIIIRFYFDIVAKQMVMEQISPGLQIPMWIPYLAVPIGCFLIILRTIQKMVLDMRKVEANEEEAA